MKKKNANTEERSNNDEITPMKNHVYLKHRITLYLTKREITTKIINIKMDKEYRDDPTMEIKIGM